MKHILKSSIIAFLLGLVIFSGTSVFAWQTFHGTTEITITDQDAPFLLELLVPIEGAPLLSNPEMHALLDDEYDVPAFLIAMNGYRDGEGYGSSQLYGNVPVTRSVDENDCYTLTFLSTHPSTYKIALVFADGTVTASSVITQTKMVATITFDGQTVSFSESDLNSLPFPLYERDFAFYFETILVMIGFILGMLVVELFIALQFGYRGKKAAFILIGLYVVYYLISTFLQWLREATMFDPFSFFLPYLIILLVTSLTVVQSIVWAKRFPRQSPLVVLMYVILGNAVLIGFSIYGFYATGGLFSY
ncbi:MAG TPA: hypothetical protein DCR44_04765 [Acholeplasmatales bacterium]|nr:hypothetical protein [Acholeplasmatales bacterium]